MTDSHLPAPRSRLAGWREMLVHIVLTLVGLLFAAGLEEALIPVVLLASAIIFAVRWKGWRTAGGGADGDALDRVAELEERVHLLESEHSRMLELEERLDFAERLLTQGAEERRERQ